MRFRKTDIEKITSALLTASYEHFKLMTETSISFDEYCTVVLSILKDKSKIYKEED